MDLPDQGRLVQARQPEHRDGGQGQDCQLQQQATWRGMSFDFGQLFGVSIGTGLGVVAQAFL